MNNPKQETHGINLSKKLSTPLLHQLGMSPEFVQMLTKKPVYACLQGKNLELWTNARRDEYYNIHRQHQLLAVDTSDRLNFSVELSSEELKTATDIIKQAVVAYEAKTLEKNVKKVITQNRIVYNRATARTIEAPTAEFLKLATERVKNLRVGRTALRGGRVVNSYGYGAECDHLEVILTNKPHGEPDNKQQKVVDLMNGYSLIIRAFRGRAQSCAGGSGSYTVNENHLNHVQLASVQKSEIANVYGNG